MKFLSHFNHTFSSGYTIPVALWTLIDKVKSCNGMYLTSPDYIKTSKIQNREYLESWANMLQDGNYLYPEGQEGENAPVLVLNDSQFNNQPSVNFTDNGNQRLKLRFPVEVATIIMVYLVREAGAYLIYSPETLVGNQPADNLHYDNFPPGENGKLWASCTLSNNFVYNATSRINSRFISSDVFVPLNTPRVLSVTNFGGTGRKENVFGFGGRRGQPNGKQEPAYSINESESVKGKLAAILTFSEVLDTDTLLAIETELAKLYINYDGTVLSETPNLKGLINQQFSFDFSTIAIDEWYTIESYELVSPSAFDLNIVGSVLTGVPTTVYDGSITIRITNNGGFVKDFDIPIELCRQDPLISDLPDLASLTLVLSAANSDIDGSTYGVKFDAFGQVNRWEDARRLVSKTLYATQLSEESPFLTASYIESDDTNHAVNFSDISSLKLNTSLSAKTFVWVYEQVSYGERHMLDTFPDIKETGELWTVSNNTQVHGTTPVTQLETKIQNININTLNFKVPLLTRYIIVGRHPSTLVNFSGFEKLKGNLFFFGAWTSALTDEQITDLVKVLASRYFNDFPYVFSTATEFRTQSEIIVDLKQKVIDLEQRPVTYTLNTNYLDMSVSDEGILTLTANIDDSVLIDVDVTNDLNNTSNLKFYLDITLKTNSLYLDFKKVINPATIEALYIPTIDSLTISGGIINSWREYRKEVLSLTGVNVEANNLYLLDNKTAASFNINGSSFFTSPATSGKAFIIAYIRKPNSSGRALLLGQTAATDFMSGVDGVFLDNSLSSASIRNNIQYINGKPEPLNYRFISNLLHVVIINSNTLISFDTVAKDRVFNDSSVKGYIAFIGVLNTNVTELEAKGINKALRDYYDAPKSISIFNFDNSIVDTSNRSKIATLSESSGAYTSLRKFGSQALNLYNGTTFRQLVIPNQSDFAFIHEDFTISLWLNINKPLEATDVFNIYNQTGLGIYLYQNKLFISSTGLFNLAEAIIDLSPNFYSNIEYNHLEFVRKNELLYIFINGELQVAVPYDIPLVDTNSPIKIGSSNVMPNTSTLVISIDNLAVYRRTALHTEAFTVPNSPYS